MKGERTSVVPLTNPRTTTLKNPTEIRFPGRIMTSRLLEEALTLPNKPLTISAPRSLTNLRRHRLQQAAELKGTG